MAINLKRYAVVSLHNSSRETIERYLPSNYQVAAFIPAQCRLRRCADLLRTLRAGGGSRRSRLDPGRLCAASSCQRSAPRPRDRPVSSGDEGTAGCVTRQCMTFQGVPGALTASVSS